MKQTRIYATGRRKTAIARVWLSPGTGKVDVNGRDLICLPLGMGTDEKIWDQMLSWATLPAIVSEEVG